MRVFAISDLHLSHHTPKAMDIFGSHWKNHFEKIRENWIANVTEEDVVLIAGDISWAMHLEEAKPDLEAICGLPGKKILMKGNHDFWHGSLGKTRALLTNETQFMQNDVIVIGDYAFAGTRGWKQRGDSDFTESDEKIYMREVERLRLSLKNVPADKKLIGMMHYPPFGSEQEETEFTELFREYGAKKVVYGHIHGRAAMSGEYAEIRLGETEFILTSCDALNFRLKMIDDCSQIL